MAGPVFGDKSFDIFIGWVEDFIEEEVDWVDSFEANFFGELEEGTF